MGLRNSPATNPETWLTRLRATLLGLQFRVTVLVMALIVAVTTILCGQAVDMAWRSALANDRSELMLTGRLLALSLAEPLGEGQSSRVQNLLEDADATIGTAFAQVTSLGGKVLAHAGMITPNTITNLAPKHRAPVGTPIEWHAVELDSRILSVTLPVTASATSSRQTRQILGYVSLGIDRSGSIQRFDANADVLTGSAIAIVLLVVPFGFLIGRRVVKPLHVMANTAERFSDGDLDARAEVSRRDEIGLLARRFNEMADQVQQKQQQVTRLNEHLEHRVRERTAQLRDLAARDPLTGLYNRRHFNEELTRRLAEADRYSKDLAVILIDVDDFKNVNDTFGHQDGDRVLSALATSIQSALRTMDIAARFGGDEFTVLMPESSCGDARVLAARIMEKLDHDLNQQFGRPLITLSVGVACLSRQTTRTTDALIQAADEAMYRAKEGGKNQIMSGQTISQ